jgi:hypothetical protein
VETKRLADAFDQKLFVALVRAARECLSEQGKADVGILDVCPRLVFQRVARQKGIELIDGIIGKGIKRILELILFGMRGRPDV